MPTACSIQGQSSPVAALGWNLVKQGRYASALAEFNLVLAYLPDHASAKEGRAAS